MAEAPAVRKTTLRPFGLNEVEKLKLKEEALRTKTRQECFELGILTVKDLDDEELVKGRCRDHTGRIPQRNKHTELIPSDLFDEMVAEHEARYRQRLRETLNDALDVAVEVMNDDTVEPRDRLEAAKWVTERAAGKSVEHIAHTVEMKPWEGMLTDISGIGAISRAKHRELQAEGGRAGIIDVEIVDDDDVPLQGVPVAGEGDAEPDVVQIHQPRPDEPGGEPTAGPLQEGEGAIPRAEDDGRGSDVHHGEVQRGQVGTDGATASDPLQQGTSVRQESDTAIRYVDGERDFGRDPAMDAPEREPAPVVPDVYEQYGSKRTERQTYADQVRNAETLAARRKAAKDRVQNAKKYRKIARATGADAIKDEITGATVADDGSITFE